MKKFDPTLNTVFTDDGKPVIAPGGAAQRLNH